jgi:peptidoglycan/LPS O-acetylase OafA/YrhL
MADRQLLQRSDIGNYQPEIDGLRALAVSAVIANHFREYVLPGGYLGVDIFFVISGYVILSSILTGKADSITDFLFHFYARRVRRIIPALVLFVVICGLATCLVSPNSTFSIKTGIAALFAVSNIQLLWQSTNYFSPSTQYNTFMHTWSLGVEEQFYLIFPLIVYLCVYYRERTYGRHLLLVILAALSLASIAYNITLSRTDPSAAFFLMPARFWELGMGAMTYLSVSLTGQRRRSSFPTGSSGFLILVIIATLFAPARFVMPATILIVATTGLLIAAVTPQSITYRALTLRPVLFIGKISYSLYLWHWGVLSVSRWFVDDTIWSIPGLLALTLAFASLSYFYVEAPLRRASWSTYNWRTIACGACACLVSAILLYTWSVPLKMQFAAMATRLNPVTFAQEPMVQEILSCHLPSSTTDPIGLCLTPVDRHKRIVYIIGDSHADNHLPSILLAAKQFNDLEIHYLVEWGFISSLSGVPKCKDHSSRPCIDDSFDKHMEFFNENLKRGDIVIFSWARDRVVYEGSMPRERYPLALKYLKEDLVKLKFTVTSKDADLVLVDDIPKPCNNSVNWQIIYVRGAYQLCTTTLAISREDRRPLTELFKSLVSDRVHYFDPHDVLCRGDTCGIYDPDLKSLIYSENSPHFPVSRPSPKPLADAWISYFHRLLPGLTPVIE